MIIYLHRDFTCGTSYGRSHGRLVVVAEVTVVTTPLNLTTLFAGVAEKFVPVKVTTVPLMPAVGEKPVRVNSACWLVVELGHCFHFHTRK